MPSSRLFEIMYNDQVFEFLFFGFRQGIVCQRGIGEHRIASFFGDFQSI